MKFFIVLTLVMAALSWAVSSFDIRIAELHQSNLLPGDVRRVVRMSEVFAHGFGLATIAASIWLLAPELRRHLPRLTLCGLASSGLANLAKLCVSRLRPRSFLNNAHGLTLPESTAETWNSNHDYVTMADTANSYFLQSFPSAHAAMATGTAVGLCWLFPKGRWLFITLATLGCYQRIQSNAHWTSDVFAGAAIGTIVAGMLIQNWGLGYALGKIETGPNVSPAVVANENDIT